jgi:2-phosphosulfolactate phosphatase
VHFTDQRDYQIRFECGERGLAALADCTRFVIIDVLSFSTCVVVAVEAGAEIFPFMWKDERAEQHARERGALLAGGPGSPYSLAVASLASVPRGTRLVLPSPNGSTLAYTADEHGVVLAGCLRNRSAVSELLNREPGPVAVIAAGERWSDRTLRPCFEDTIGAGAIIAELNGSRSPEAVSAVAAYQAVAGRLGDALLRCSSGRELIEKGHPRNVEMAAALDASHCVPVLREGRFVRAEP